jgi:hypothetical protein
MGDGWLGNPVSHAVSKLIRLRFNYEALNFDKSGGGTKTLKGGTELGGGVIKIKRHL